MIYVVFKPTKKTRFIEELLSEVSEFNPLDPNIHAVFTDPEEAYECAFKLLREDQ